MKDKEIDVHANEIAKKMVKENPLIKFSVYTVNQVSTLRMLSDKLNELFSNFKSEGEDKIVVDGKEFQQAYGYSWLYVLGAYEALRTMDQEDGIFKEKLKKNIKSLKQDFANLRIPFAKQEYAKKHSKFIENEASVHNIEVGPEGGDLKFKIKGKIYSIRDFINRFNRLIGNIKPEDVLKDLRNASKK